MSFSITLLRTHSNAVVKLSDDVNILIGGSIITDGERRIVRTHFCYVHVFSCTVLHVPVANLSVSRAWRCSSAGSMSSGAVRMDGANNIDRIAGRVMRQRRGTECSCGQRRLI